MPTAVRRKIGIEPLDVDLVVGPSLSAADTQEIDAFFRERRKQNDKSPAVRAIRKQLPGKKTHIQVGNMGITFENVSDIKPIRYPVGVPVARGVAHSAARKAAPSARKAAPDKKKK